MRLVLDLRFPPRSGEAGPGERRLDLAALALLARDPRGLAGLLWGERYERVSVHEGELPPSGVQAGAAGLAALARSQAWELHEPGGVRELGRAAFLFRAARRFLAAMPAELVRGGRLLRKARRLAATDVALPPVRGRPRSVTYLRSDPTLAWMGAYVGGAATHTTGVVNGFVDNGVDVHVFAAERPERTERAPFTRVPVRRLHHLVFWLTVTAYGEDMVAAARTRPADLVYQRYSLGSYAGLELARELGVPLVLEFNGSEVWAERNWGSGELQLVEALSALERRNVESASLVVVVSDVLKRQLMEEGIPAERVLVNPNGVDVERLAPLRERPPAAWRERLGLTELPTVGFVGTFGLWHGVKLLPALVGAVAAAAPETRWILIGDGPLHGEVRAEIEERGLSELVTMPGVVPHERALELLAACEACVSPHVPNPDGTPFFGSPTKLFEYMGLARPIVASDLEQIGEVIEHERTGLLAPPGDAGAAAEAVLRLLGDPDLRERLGAAALEEARARYSWAAHVARILDALEPAPVSGPEPQPAAASE